MTLSDKGQAVAAAQAEKEADAALFAATASEADLKVSELLLSISEHNVGPRMAILAGGTTAMVRYAAVQIIAGKPDLQVSDIIGAFLRMAQTAATQLLPTIKALAAQRAEEETGPDADDPPSA